MDLQQHDIFVDCPVQSQFAHQFVQGADSTATDRPGSFGNVIVDVGVFEHGAELVFILFSYQPGIEILLVTEEDFVVSFVHLKCAPFGCIGYIQFPIITNSDAHFSTILKSSQEITPVYGLVLESFHSVWHRR
jgi:hypothetical protein